MLGVPFNGDGMPPEAENPAQGVRDAGLVTRLTDCGHRLTDLGDLAVPAVSRRRDPDTGVLNQEAWRQVTGRPAGALTKREGQEVRVFLMGDAASCDRSPRMA